MGRTARGPDPNWSFPFPDARVTIPPVQLVAASRSLRPPISAVVVGVLAGVALLAGGLFLAWLAFATPMVTALAPAALRPTLAQMAMGGLVWGVALVAPPAFAFVGAWRLSRVFRALTARPQPGLLSAAAKQLGDDYTAVSEVVLPDGRVIHDLVVGPFGVAVIADMPPSRYVRRTGGSWELKGPGRPLGPHGEPARAGRPRRRAGQALVRRHGAGLRPEGLLGARHERRDAHPDAELRGDHPRADPGLAHVASALAHPERRAARRDRRTDPRAALTRRRRCRSGVSGRRTPRASGGTGELGW